MNQNIVEIQIAGIPKIFPTFEYTGKIGTYNRVILLGNHSEKIITEDMYRTIYDSNYDKRMVQAVIYNKYKLRIMANEYLRADLIEFAKYGYVITQDGVRHKMKVLEVNYNKQDGTELGTYEITYADINPYNYKNQELPINNFLEHYQLQEEFETDQLVSLTLTDSNTTPFVSSIDNEWFFIQNTPIGGTVMNIFYSELLPEFVVVPAEEEKEEVAGVEKVTRSRGFRALRARWYLKTEEKNIVAKYLPRVDTVTITFASGTYTSLERIIPEINPIKADLFQVDITLKYELLDFYPENL